MSPKLGYAFLKETPMKKKVLIRKYIRKTYFFMLKAIPSLKCNNTKVIAH